MLIFAKRLSIKMFEFLGVIVASGLFAGSVFLIGNLILELLYVLPELVYDTPTQIFYWSFVCGYLLMMLGWCVWSWWSVLMYFA